MRSGLKMDSKSNNILGIDTSNYKTSVAVIDKEGRIISDLRRLLPVKTGERGLRQSDALFQHVINLPHLLEEAVLKDIGGVAVSIKPRPQEGSYMPVFRAGECCARSIAAALSVPLFEFSHQEGHIEAVKFYSAFKDKKQLLCYHISGGTCELLKVDGQNITLIGRSLDISFGQLLDRIGVALGMDFPCGEEMDRLCIRAASASDTEPAYTGVLSRIKVKDCNINLSGMETQAMRAIENIGNAKKENADILRRDLIIELFDRISQSLVELTKQAADMTGITDVLFSGGVAESMYIRNKISSAFKNNDIRTEFGMQRLSSDNAVGIALLGGKMLWQ